MTARFFHGMLCLLLSAPLLASDQRTAAAEQGAEAEFELRPNGAVADAGWALARLNDGGNISSQSFVYPETSHPVRLYLIDTAVAHTGTWFAANPNFKSFSSTLIRGNSDPTSSSAFSHGTKLLSLIAGPETGAALGTPIHVVNYDIYPNGEGSSGSSSALLAKALLQARQHHIANQGTANAMPGVVCIASGTVDQASSSTLQQAINGAVAAGLTVIVSAGNLGVDVASYLPAAYGIADTGIVCVGASSATNGIWTGSNLGAAVDLYAPGDQVRVLHFANPAPGTYDTMSGTSPAAALAAAAALIELSKNPELSPAQVEAALTTVTYPAPSPSVGLIQVQPDPEDDSDLDGSIDLLESFFGSNPADPAVRPEPMTMTRHGGQVSLGFEIAADLFVSPVGGGTNPPYGLANGGQWKVLCSENLKDWQAASGTLTVGSAINGKRTITFSMPSASSSCFLRIEVNPAP
jgi:hypothetical protein